MATRKENPCSIVDLFLEYVTVKDVFEPMGRFTQHYACEEDVAPINANASSGAKKKENLQQCKETDSKARKRLKFDKQRTWNFSTGLFSGDALKNEKRNANPQCTGICETFKTSSYCEACYQTLSSTLPSRR